MADQSPNAGYTLANMQSRIADELARTDLTSQIALCINDAIDFYQSIRFDFNESRDLTFTTNVGQEFYTGADLADIPTLIYIDYVILYLGSIPWPLHRRAPIDIERLNQNGLMKGQPWNYCYYNQQLRLGPVPDNNYSMRIAANITYPAPSSTTQTGNFWMTEAEKLIRARAKWGIHTHYTRNATEAAKMKEAELEALAQLKGRSNRLTGTGIIQPMVF
jgi:hypothetical protein